LHRWFIRDELCPDSESFKQELSHFAINLLLLGDETVVMSAGDHHDLCLRKSALKFGNDGPEERFLDIPAEYIVRGFLLCGVSV
jgi:hypothetical protein